MTPRVLWLHSDKSGCGGYRCYAPALGLDALGLATSHTFVLHKDVRLDCETAVDGTSLYDDVDVIVLQRAVGPQFVEVVQRAQRLGIATVFELDDDLWHIPRHNPSHQFWAHKQTQHYLATAMQLAGHIVVSTEALRRVVVARGFQRDRVSVCWNHLQPAVWRDPIAHVAPVEHDGTVIVGWQGSTTHSADFRVAIPAVQRILAEFPQTHLRLFGSIPLSLRGEIDTARFSWVHPVEFSRYPATLKFLGFDISLAPLTPSVFNTSKSNIKVIEAAALGVPSVASPCAYGETITHGVDGFLAETPDEWYRALRTLVADATRRREMGASAREMVWRAWGPDHARTWVAAFAAAHRVLTLQSPP